MSLMESFCIYKVLNPGALITEVDRMAGGKKGKIKIGTS